MRGTLELWVARGEPMDVLKSLNARTLEYPLLLVVLAFLFVLATSPEWWQTAVIAQVDMTLAFFTVAALLLFFSLYRNGRSTKAESLGLAVLLALATLAKGPVGILLPSLTIFVFLCIERNLVFLKKLHMLPSAALFLLVAGS